MSQLDGRGLWARTLLDQPLLGFLAVAFSPAANQPSNSGYGARNYPHRSKWRNATPAHKTPILTEDRTAILRQIQRRLGDGDRPDDVVMRYLADALNHPEGGERHQRAKAELNYRQLNAQTKATKAQLEAIEVQRKAAEAEAKVAEASIITAKATERAAEAAERNAKYLLWSVVVASISAIASAISAYFSYWSAVHPR